MNAFRHTLVLLLLGVLVAARPARGEERVLERIAAVKSLSADEADGAVLARVRGQVLNFHPGISMVFIHDGETGIYVQTQLPAGEIPDLRVGSLVEVLAVTGSGGFSPILFSSKIDVIGWEPLPEPRQVDRALLMDGHFDVEWVEVKGLLVSMEKDLVMDYTVFSLDVDGTYVDVFLKYSYEGLGTMRDMMFQDVAVRGVLGTKANPLHQMTGRVIYLNDRADIEKVSGEFRVDLPMTPIDQLMRFGDDMNGMKRTRGQVVYAAEDMVYLRGEQGSLKAFLNGTAFKPGDVVELYGFPVMEPISPAFHAVHSVLFAPGPAPVPVEISLSNAGINPAWNNELVTFDAEFAHREMSLWGASTQEDWALDPARAQNILWCVSGNRLVECRLPPGVPVPEALKSGAKVRVEGLCQITPNKNPRTDAMSESFWIELAGAHSITITAQPPWWSTKVLLWILGGLMGIATLLFLWVGALRKTVLLQTNRIGEQVARETTLNERHRVARELHDTLEQGLAALSLQLERLVGKARVKMPDELPVVEKAVNTLKICREESRASIQDLRGGLLEEMDLPSALDRIISERLEETDIRLEVEVRGAARRLTLFAEHQISRIVTEAASNAVEHAQPSLIRVVLRYGDDRLRVEVVDDGHGFDVEKVKNAGRFGVLGMSERAIRLKGTLEIESREGAGARVVLDIPARETENER